MVKVKRGQIEEVVVHSENKLGVQWWPLPEGNCDLPVSEPNPLSWYVISIIFHIKRVYFDGI